MTLNAGNPDPQKGMGIDIIQEKSSLSVYLMGYECDKVCISIFDDKETLVATSPIFNTSTLFWDISAMNWKSGTYQIQINSINGQCQFVKNIVFSN